MNESNTPPLRSQAIHQLRVKLGARIWRVIEVPSDIELGLLHRVIQRAMGWENAHLYGFSIGAKNWSRSQFWNMIDNENVTLVSVAPEKGCRLGYMYDFGDGWVHRIFVEKVHTIYQANFIPTCLRGRGACPPEDSRLMDCESFKQAYPDFKHDEFDVEVANNRVAELWLSEDCEGCATDFPTALH